MNKIFNKLLITTAISIATFTMQAMEQPIQEQQPEMVRIITPDCPDGFEVERAPLVTQSETAKNMLSAPSGSFLEAQTNEISFSDITQPTFNIVYQCMRIIHEQGVDVRGIDSIRAILDRINSGEIAINPTIIKDALNAANFLQVSPAVLQALARQYAIYVHDNCITLDDLNDLIADVLPEIARQYYLHYGKPLQHSSIKDGSWGVSVRELLENDLVPAIKYITSEPQLYLSGCYINSLDGLQDIPEIDKVKHLSLEYNSIATIEQDAFNGLNNLRILYLKHNQVAAIEKGAFNGLGLTGLFLEHNRITTVQKGVLNGLNSLVFLKLKHNQVAAIEQDAFNGLNSLRWLYLNNNQITIILQGAFNGLNNPRMLYLKHNQIATIEQGAFSGLNHLEMLDLGYNQIEEQNQKRLRQELPGVEIYLENQRIVENNN